MNHTPNSSQPVKKKENTSISLLTLYLEKSKMNMDQEVGILVNIYFAMLPTNICVPRLSVYALEPESLSSNPDSPTSQLCMTLDK